MSSKLFFFWTGSNKVTPVIPAALTSTTALLRGGILTEDISFTLTL